MRQYIVLIVTLLIIVSLYLCQQYVLKKTGREFADIINKMSAYIEQENHERAEIALSGAKTKWKNISAMWDMFSEHNDIEEIACHLVSVEVYLKKDKAQSLNECKLLIQKIEHIIYTEKLTLANIF